MTGACRAIGGWYAGCALLLAALLILLAAPARAQTAHDGMNGEETDFSEFDADEALAYSQDAVGRPLGDFTFTNAAGETVDLSRLRGKPLVISLIYTSCYHTCPVMTDRLSEIAEGGWESLGEGSFNIVSIGFDARNDTPDRMRQFRNNHKIKRDNWLFLSGSAETIEALAENVGFIFFRSPKGFDHLAQTTIVDADGAIYRQIYGARFEAPRLVEPLKNLILGERAEAGGLEGLINKVRLFCTIYDPKAERYRFDNSLFVGLIAGLLSLGGIGFVLGRATWRLIRDNKS